MPKLTEVRRAERRNHVIDVATRLFMTRGLERTSMTDIIEASGTSAGMIYGHFKNKSDLIQTVIEQLFARRAAEFDIAVQSRGSLSPAELVSMFLNQTRRDTERPELLLELWVAANHDPELFRLVRSVGQRLLDLFAGHLTIWHQEAGLDEQEASVRGAHDAVVCLGVCQGFTVQAAILDNFDPDHYLHAVASTLPGGTRQKQ